MTEAVLEVAQVVLAGVTLVVVAVHVRRRHRRLRRPRPTFDPDSTHPFQPSADNEHVCVCGRDVGHDVHHRMAGVG